MDCGDKDRQAARQGVDSALLAHPQLLAGDGGLDLGSWVA